MFLGVVLCLGSAVAAENDAQAPVILAVGESTTAGFGVARDASWPAQLQALLDDAGHHYRVVNHGRSGSTTTMALSRLGEGLALQPAYVIIALGGNDRSMRMSAEATKETLRRMVAPYVQSGAQVFLADRTPNTDGGDAGQGLLYAELARETGATLIPSLREGLAGDPALLLSDMSHPNADGYTIIAERMFTLLQPYLEP
ncbi:MAG TPA: GDSL-type esterase/lipase family protein [Hyphomicrobiales bacterium]|nr:GDSL-type esterase/lipase family protein [Hyphomicrobiales bacterium]